MPDDTLAQTIAGPRAQAVSPARQHKKQNARRGTSALSETAFLLEHKALKGIPSKPPPVLLIVSKVSKGVGASPSTLSPITLSPSTPKAPAEFKRASNPVKAHFALRPCPSPVPLWRSRLGSVTT